MFLIINDFFYTLHIFDFWFSRHISNDKNIVLAYSKFPFHYLINSVISGIYNII